MHTQMRTAVSRVVGRALGLAALAALAACGGGGGGDRGIPKERGAIVLPFAVGQATKAQIDAGTQASGAQALTGLARCDVDVRHIQYSTVAPTGTPGQEKHATATTAVFVPTGGAGCTGARPVLLYTHGTRTMQAYNMADVRPVDENNKPITTNTEARLVMAMFAAQGFIVVAPNYLGYDQSTLDWHPYVNGEAQAKDVVDALRAATTYLNTGSGATKPSGKLVVTGYSQGGYVAMAAHKIIERDYPNEFGLVASVPMSGPYNLVGFTDVVMNVQVNVGATQFTPLVITSYQRSYGDIYGAPVEVYQPPYDQTAPGLFPGSLTDAQLLEQNKLPNDPTFRAMFGAGGLVQDSFRAGYATSKFRARLAENTLIDWTPRARMALCGGAQDPIVFWGPNTPVAQGQFASRGAQVPAFNLENRATLPAGAMGDQLYGGFQQKKTAATYHSDVAPFCMVIGRSFFQQVLAAAP